MTLSSVDATEPTKLTATTEAVASPTDTKTHQLGLTTLDPAKQALDAGLSFEGKVIAQIDTLNEQSEEFTKTMNLLLDLNAALSALDTEKPEMNDNIKSLIDQLKEKGIAFGYDSSKALTKEKLSGMKSTLNSHLDKTKMFLQQNFTKIQTKVTDMQSILDILKKINELQNRLHEEIIRGSRKQ
jgi:hypothetical protein